MRFRSRMLTMLANGEITLYELYVYGIRDRREILYTSRRPMKADNALTHRLD